MLCDEPEEPRDQRAVGGGSRGFAARGGTGTSPPVVELRGVTTRYGSTVVNRRASLAVRAGTVHALVGENGAGKSTLVKVLGGLVAPVEGEIVLAGERLAALTPAEAIRRGIGVVHQHFMLVPTLTVTENVVLGREARRGPLLDLRRAAASVAEVSARYGLRVEPAALVSDLSVGERQRVEILKVLYRGARLLVLDEPTAVLTPPEVRELFGVLRRLVEAGGAAVLVSHKLDEVMEIAARVTVLRRGAVVLDAPTAATAPADIARAMVGRDVRLAAEARRSPPPGREVAPALALEDLRVRRPDGAESVRGVSLAARPGEILGVAGVEGNGQSELALALCGLLPVSGGRVLLRGEDVTGWPPRALLRRGLAHLPEDRQERGLVLDLTVAENLALGREAGAGARGPFLSPARLAAAGRRLAARFAVRPDDPALAARALSGGNQQKVALARALARTPVVLVAAQPTRGVDVGAIEILWRELRSARDAGAAVLLFSAELSELRALADRIVVMVRGGVIAERSPAASEEELGLLMTGAPA